MRKNYFFTCLSAVLLSAVPVKAVDWTVLNTANTSSGLPSDEVHSLAFGKDGTLYVATDRAFSSLKDGEWTVYAQEHGYTWADARTDKLYFDSNDNLWICSEDNGLARMSVDGTFTYYTESENEGEGLATTYVKDIVEDGEGGYYIANSAMFGSLVTHLDKDGNWKYYDYTTVSSNPMEVVSSVAYDKATSTLYIGTVSNGLMLWKEDKFVPVNDDYAMYPISAIVMDGKGKLYAASDYGLIVVDLGNGEATLLTSENGLADSYCETVAIDRDGNIWVGSDGKGATCISASDSSMTIYDTTTGLTSNDIYAIAFDDANNPWFGTNIGGICYRQDDVWTHIGSSGLAANDVLSIYFGEDDVWYATGGGLSQRKGGLWFNHYFQEDYGCTLLSNHVCSIFEDNRADKTGTMWAGGYGGIAQYYEFFGDYYWAYFSPELPEGVTEANCQFNLMQADNGDLWLTTYGVNLGIAKFNDDTESFTFYNNENVEVLPENTGSFFIARQAPDGSIWFCSVSGVLIENNGEFSFKTFTTTLEMDNGNGEVQVFTDSNVRDVYFDGNGKAWISKLTGLVVYDLGTGGQTYELGPDDDPISFASGIVLDGDGNAFIGTMFDGLYIRNAAGEYFHLGEADGLPTELSVRKLYLRDGSLYLCTDNGVYVCDTPEELVKKSGIESAIADNTQFRPVCDGKNVTLPQNTTAYVVTSIDGSRVASGSVSEGSANINLDTLGSGFYIVSYRLNGKWANEKVVIK